MALNRSLVIFAIVIAIAPAISIAMEYIVGGDEGWKRGVDYQAWAQDKQFIVGDTLLFKYNASTHNVYKITNVTQFQNCEVPKNKSLGSFDGNTTITLATAGKKWYICGVAGHCQGGMKLNITVLDSATPTNPTPSNPSPSNPAPSSSAPTLYPNQPIFQIFLGVIFTTFAMVMV